MEDAKVSKHLSGGVCYLFNVLLGIGGIKVDKRRPAGVFNRSRLCHLDTEVSVIPGAPWARTDMITLLGPSSLLVNRRHFDKAPRFDAAVDRSLRAW